MRQLPLFPPEPVPDRPKPRPPASSLGLEHQVSEYLVYLARVGKAGHTLAATRRDLDQLVQAVGPRSVAEVATANLRAFVHGLSQERSNGPASLRRKVATLKAFFRYLQREGCLTADPSAAIPYPQLPESEAEPLSVDEARRLLDSVESTAHRALLLLMLDAGLKREEVLVLQAGDVVLDGPAGSVVDISRGLAAKRVRARSVPLSERLAEALGQHRRDLPTDEVLFPLSTRGVDFIVREAGRRAELRRGSLTPQRLRDTFASHWLVRRLPREWAERDGDLRRGLEARHDRELIDLLGLAPTSLAVARYRRAAVRLEHDRAEAGLLADGRLAPPDQFE